MKPNLKKPYTLQSFLAGIQPVYRKEYAPKEWFYFQTATEAHFPLTTVNDVGCKIHHIEDGKNSAHSESEYDCFEPLQEVTRWYNVYLKPDESLFVGSVSYASEGDAKKAATDCINEGIKLLETRSITYTIE